MSKRAKKKSNRNRIYIYIIIIVAIILLCGLFFFLGRSTNGVNDTDVPVSDKTEPSMTDDDDTIIKTETYNGPELKRGYYKAKNTDGTFSVLVIFKNSSRCKFYPHITEYNIDEERDNDEGSYWWYGEHWSVQGHGQEEEAAKQTNRINMYWHPGVGIFNGQRDSFWLDVQENETVLQTSKTTGETTLYTLVKEF